MAYFMSHAKNKSEQSELCSDVANNPNCDTKGPLSVRWALCIKGGTRKKTNNLQKSKTQLFAQFNWVETE